MNPVDYVLFLAANVRYRVRFEVEKGAVIHFVVQIELFEDGKWMPVVRYDTAHGFAHRDRYSAGGTAGSHELLPYSDFNQAFTFAVKDVRTNWEEWIREFRRRSP